MLVDEFAIELLVAFLYNYSLSQTYIEQFEEKSSFSFVSSSCNQVNWQI